jgi:hypothetical protein
MLDYRQASTPGNKLVCHIVKTEVLCEKIASESGYYNLDSVNEMSGTSTQSTRLRLQSSVLDFKASMLDLANTPIAAFFSHVPDLHLHEWVLHTPTNKSTFSAPYIAERISITDFPMPTVAEDHISALNELRVAAHGLIDAFLQVDAATSVVLPALLYHCRMAYAMYILVRIYVATTAAGNTYGAFFDPESLDLEQYLRRLVAKGGEVMQIDPHCGAALLFGACPRMRDWFANYKATYVSHNTAALGAPDGHFAEMSRIYSEWPAFHDDGFDLGLNNLFSDSLAGHDFNAEAGSNDYGSFNV